VSASLPQSIALAGLLWLALLAAIAAVVTWRGADPTRIRTALLPGVSVIAVITLTTWAGAALAGTRGVAVGVMVLLFAIFGVFAHLHAMHRGRPVAAADNRLLPGRSA